MVLSGPLGVVLLLVGFVHTARLVRPDAPRAAPVGAVLTFAGTPGFLARLGVRDRAQAIVRAREAGLGDSEPLSPR